VSGAAATVGASRYPVRTERGAREVAERVSQAVGASRRDAVVRLIRAEAAADRARVRCRVAAVEEAAADVTARGRKFERHRDLRCIRSREVLVAAAVEAHAAATAARVNRADVRRAVDVVRIHPRRHRVLHRVRRRAVAMVGEAVVEEVPAAEADDRRTVVQRCPHRRPHSPEWGNKGKVRQSCSTSRSKVV
jgi:hypothetical protein